MDIKIVKSESDEDMALYQGADVAIPFVVSEKDGEVEIQVYASQSKTAVEFQKKFGGSEETLFSQEAREWAYERFCNYLTRHEFAPEDEAGDIFHNYRVSEADTALIRDGTVMLTEDSVDDYENLTEYDLETMLSYGHLCCAATVDGKIVAVACTNYPPDEDGSDMEIGVETAEDYLSQGYGTSCAAALVNELKQHGLDTLYECESQNTASKKLIAKLGGKQYGQNFCVIGHRVEMQTKEI